jgi:rubrerythrin
MTLGQQAIQQAVQHTSQETAIRMLNERLDIKLISKVTKLSQEEIKRLERKRN